MAGHQINTEEDEWIVLRSNVSICYLDEKELHLQCLLHMGVGPLKDALPSGEMICECILN